MRLCLHNAGQQREVGKRPRLLCGQRQLEGECARPVTLGAAHRAPVCLEAAAQAGTSVPPAQAVRLMDASVRWPERKCL